jgi:hypothetical protein
MASLGPTHHRAHWIGWRGDRAGLVILIDCSKIAIQAAGEAFAVHDAQKILARVLPCLNPV